jgi:hypothetical protein
MGSQYIPPQLTVDSQDPHKLLLGCGHDYPEVDVNVYDKGSTVWKSDGRQMTDGNVKIIAVGKKACDRMKGTDRFWCQWYNNGQNFKKAQHKTIKIGTQTFIIAPPSSYAGQHSTYGPTALMGGFHTAQSSRSRQCCAPPGTFTPFKDKPASTGAPLANVRFMDEETEQWQCHRKFVGEASSCKSEMQVYIHVCPKCKCRGADGKLTSESVQFITKHRMLNNEKACRPWFILADAGVRFMIASVRKKVMQHYNEKRSECGCLADLSNADKVCPNLASE